jgi:general nucleoside transport system permease protein
MAQVALEKSKIGLQRYKLTRKRVLALLLLLLAAVILGRGNASLTGETVSILTLEPGNVADVAKISIATLSFLNITGIFFLAVAILALVPLTEQLERVATVLMVIVGILLIPTMMIAAAAGTNTNIVTLFAESMQLATPIAIGAMAGIWCERAGVVNVAIEGMMLFSACIGFTAVFFLKQVIPPEQVYAVLALGVLIAVITGGIIALLHAWLSITFSTDQIVSGTVINILAVGATSFIRREYLLSTDSGLQTLPKVPLPILSQLPIVGDAFFNSKPIFYMMFIVIFGTYIILFYTKWGLRMRAVGEHPSAADTLGINVNRVRWISVFVSGLIAGLAGAWFSLEATGRFNDNMTNGLGFIALAAMIFGKWNPFGAFAGAILFGFATALGTRFQIMNVPVPSQFLNMVPYVLTLVVLAGLVGRAAAPKAVGTPYKKE